MGSASGLTFIFMEVSEMKKCQECGALFRGKVSFCPKCGMPTDEMMKKDTFVKYKTAKDSRSFRIAGVIIGAVVVIAACIAVIILL